MKFYRFHHPADGGKSFCLHNQAKQVFLLEYVCYCRALSPVIPQYLELRLVE